MTKQEYIDAVEDAKSEFLICSDEEADDACKFVAKLLQIELDRMEANEPYAKRTISEYMAMESRVYGFYDNDVRLMIEEGFD